MGLRTAGERRRATSGRRHAEDRTGGSAGEPVLAAAGLLGAPVRVAGLRSGSVEDVVLGADLSVVLGVVVETRAGERRFLPWVAARLEGDALVASSPLALLGGVELAYYLESGVGLRRLDAVRLAAAGQPAGAVSDVLLDPSGRVHALVVARAAGVAERVPIGDTLVRWRAGELLELSVGARGASPPGEERKVALAS